MKTTSSFVETVLGRISADEIGPTDIHDHFIGSPPAVYAHKDPDLVLNDEGAALVQLNHFREAGGSTLVDFTTMDYGRNPSALRRLSAASGVHIVAVTGFNQGKFSQLIIGDRSVDDVSESLLQDFGKSGMDDSGVRPGVIKAATSLNGRTRAEEISLLAAARIHRETGVPVMNHTEAGTFGVEQLDILTSNGVPPEWITLCHLDRNLDFDYHVRLLKLGCFLSFDQIGKTKYATDRARAEMLVRLARAGYGSQLMIGGDYARLSYWRA